MLKTGTFLLALVALCTASLLSETQYQKSFTQFMKSHRKTYDNDEFKYRYGIYKNNLDYILRHNAKGLPFKLEANLFADLTHEEFKTYYLGTKLSTLVNKGLQHTSSRTVQSSADPLPKQLDWRELGAVTPVKDQGQCGSCYAFSTTGSVEGCHYLATNKLVDLSEQNIVDCSWEYGNEGCGGGLMTSSMDYIIKNNGIATEESYPYKATDSHTCKFNSSTVGATLSSYQNVPSGNETALLYAASIGPVSVAIDASRLSFQFYKSGVYYEPQCSSVNLDHGVLVVGWGAESDGTPYYIVKNSWATTWGDNGYIKMARNRDNHCGIATMATLPVCN